MTPERMSLPINKLVGFEYFVHDTERIASFYRERLGLQEAGRSSAELEQRSSQQTRVFRAGSALVACSAPLAGDARAARYLARHPEGIGSLLFEVSNIEDTFARLEANGATPVTEIETVLDASGAFKSFSITTPFGDTLFQFVERVGLGEAWPGIALESSADAAESRFTDVDHVTVNLRTMKPALLWLEHVLELEPFWGVEFHTSDFEPGEGSGLRSQVFWHRASGFKLACNEPLRPAFERSQISVFCDENRGDGVQHVALGVRDLTRSVEELRESGVGLMPAPPGYYARLSEHLQRLGLERIDEDEAKLERLGILVDGSGPGAYLLQIFLKDSARLFGDADAGPFFFELIQRKGDAGFGAGNFRALFSSVEQQQLARAG